MNKTNKILIKVIIGLFAILMIFIAFFIGVSVGEKYANNEAVTSTTVFNKITNSALLTSQVVYIDQKSSISVNNDSEWSSLLWGQTITSKGLMKVSVGVDISSVKDTDIAVDTASKRITINLSAAKILNTELVGDIEITNQQGILKSLFANDPNADFNQALSQLVTDANAAVNADPAVLTAAYQQCVQIITNLYKGTGYTVVVNKI
jgi:hypothetical protein